MLDLIEGLQKVSSAKPIFWTLAKTRMCMYIHAERLATMPLRRVSVEGVWSIFRYWTIHEAAKRILKHMHIGGVNFPHPFKYIILM